MKIKMKRCPKCGTVLPSDAKQCYNCLHEFVRKQKKKNIKKVTFTNLSPRELMDWLASFSNRDIVGFKGKARFTQFLERWKFTSVTITYIDGEKNYDYYFSSCPGFVSKVDRYASKKIKEMENVGYEYYLDYYRTAYNKNAEEIAFWFGIFRRVASPEQRGFALCPSCHTEYPANARPNKCRCGYDFLNEKVLSYDQVTVKDLGEIIRKELNPYWEITYIYGYLRPNYMFYPRTDTSLFRKIVRKIGGKLTNRDLQGRYYEKLHEARIRPRAWKLYNCKIYVAKVTDPDALPVSQGLELTYKDVFMEISKTIYGHEFPELDKFTWFSYVDAEEHEPAGWQDIFGWFPYDDNEVSAKLYFLKDGGVYDDLKFPLFRQYEKRTESSRK